MMKKARGVGRRNALAQMGLLAILPSLASAWPVMAQGSSAFRAPGGPMLFTRKLLRELPGGAVIIVTRRFEIRFLPQAGGYRVEGVQTSAHVSAPDSLAALARIEEQRQETGFFPLQLDMAGRIIAGPGKAEAADLGQAVDEAFAWLARRPITPSARSAAMEFVIGLQTVANLITTAVPLDLFTGEVAPLERSQQIPMPNGNLGRVSVSYAGTASAGGGLLGRAQRVVTTDAGGSALRSIEEWTLERMPTAHSR